MPVLESCPPGAVHHYGGHLSTFWLWGSEGSKKGVRFDGDEVVRELFETGLGDTRLVRITLLPLPAKESQSVRIAVGGQARRSYGTSSGQTSLSFRY